MKAIMIIYHDSDKLKKKKTKYVKSNLILIIRLYLN